MKWVLSECDEAAAASLVRDLGLHPLIARLMAGRGICDPPAVREFLSCDLSSLSDPGIFLGMDRAVDRIKKAVMDREKIVIYGDYDVDGVTGASLLYLALTACGALVECYIPERLSEGYGLNSGALKKIKASGAGLVVTVDCGITSLPEAGLASSLGLDLIITDHHEFPNSKLESRSSSDASVPGNFDSDNSLPAAYAVLHPSLFVPGVSSRVRDDVAGLTGVGIAFKLAQALLAGSAADAGTVLSYLDLVTLGTVADVGRITGENRVLVKHGLERLSNNGDQRPGISALREVTGLDGKKITVGTVGFTLAPRINASGRLERADTAFRLLTTNSREESRSLAAALDRVNRERQSIEEIICEQAKELCIKEHTAAPGAFVLVSDAWHPGVIGIVASRIVEEFYRPTALICVKDGVGKGSARSIPGFDLYRGFTHCSDLLLGFGGHKYAAGFTISEDRISDFRERLCTVVMDAMGAQGFTRTLMVDGAVLLEDLTIELLREIEKLAPFGPGNPEPRLGVRGLKLVSTRIVGAKHLKLRLKSPTGLTIDAIAFNRAQQLGRRLRDGMRVAAVFTPRVNSWNGNIAVELEIKDLKIER